MTLTATVSETITEDSWGCPVHHYNVSLSNGLNIRRQASGGAEGVAFHLDEPKKTTASKKIGRLSKFKKMSGYVIVNLKTEEVIICG